MAPVVIHRQGAFGDRLLCAQMVAILNDHGISAKWWDADANMRALVDVPIYDGEPSIWWWFNYHIEQAWDGRSILRKAMDRFCDAFAYPPLSLTIPCPPVVYYDEPDIAGTDVVINSKTGDYTPYKSYPYWSELKTELDRRGLKWIDLDEQGIIGRRALNWAGKSKIYVGLETGMSHYVAAVVKKGLILQSGFSNPEYWASTYRYSHLTVNVPCGNCFKAKGCRNAHRCMAEMDAVTVADEIQEVMQT